MLGNKRHYTHSGQYKEIKLCLNMRRCQKPWKYKAKYWVTLLFLLLFLCYLSSKIIHLVNKKVMMLVVWDEKTYIFIVPKIRPRPATKWLHQGSCRNRHTKDLFIVFCVDELSCKCLHSLYTKYWHIEVLQYWVTESIGTLTELCVAVKYERTLKVTYLPLWSYPLNLAILTHMVHY